jgi:hypothetical protein
MEAIIKADLNEPQDAKNYKAMLKVQDYQFALWDLKQHLRNLLKYENVLHEGYLTAKEDTVVEHIQEKLFELLEEYQIKQDLEEM